MERTLSDEEKLRHAIEISQRRNENYYYNVSNARPKVENQKDYKLFKKMIIQIIICMLIYIIFYLITTTNYVFSEDVVSRTRKILNYDINIGQLYEYCKNHIYSGIQKYNNSLNSENNIEKEEIEKDKDKDDNTEENKNENVEENKEIKPDENTLNEIALNKDEIIVNEISEIVKTVEPEVEKTQMEKDAEEVKKTCEIRKPLSGKVTSEFGEREKISDIMSEDHKGIDIAANSGTKILAAMSGTVIAAEQNNDYGKFIKIKKDNIMTVYAHCSSLKVKKGDKVTIGQTIAKVGTTGKSTGPHLHFEIRLSDRYINPRLVIEL